MLNYFNKWRCLVQIHSEIWLDFCNIQFCIGFFFFPYSIQFRQLFLFFDYEAVYCSSPVLLPQNKFCQQSGSRNSFGKTSYWKYPLPPEWLAGYLLGTWSCNLFSCEAQGDRRTWSRKLQTKSGSIADCASLSSLKMQKCSTDKENFAEEHLHYELAWHREN